MLRVKGIVAIVGISALLVLGAACGNSEPSATPAKLAEVETASPAQGNQATAPTAVAQAQQAVAPVAPVQTSVRPVSSGSGTPAKLPVAPSASAAVDAGRSGGVSAPALLQAASSEAGIWVTGQGTISLEPDLVLLNVGVETMGDTVAEARGDAATAMDAIIQAVKAHGLSDRDIQTRSFNIWPRYEYPEVTISGTRTRQQVLVGYTVSNTAAIKIRDMDAVGKIIDDVANAGGDATRINGINFTIEDPKSFMEQLREEAVGDAIAKAEQFASLTGVSVGNLVFISEMGGSGPIVADFAQAEGFALAKVASVPTSVSGGELELRLNVQVVFAIQ